MPLMESRIHGCGIRNPQTWNPEFRTLLDFLTWGEDLPVENDGAAELPIDLSSEPQKKRLCS